MQYKLIDILICPECKTFPLKIQEKLKTIEEDNKNTKTNEKSKLYECDIFCGFKNELIKKIKQNKNHKSICDKCLEINIVSGYLICSKCKAKYQIIDSIPRMIPKRFSKL